MCNIENKESRNLHKNDYDHDKKKSDRDKKFKLCWKIEISLKIVYNF